MLYHSCISSNFKVKRCNRHTMFIDISPTCLYFSQLTQLNIFARNIHFVKYIHGLLNIIPWKQHLSMETTEPEKQRNQRNFPLKKKRACVPFVSWTWVGVSQTSVPIHSIEILMDWIASLLTWEKLSTWVASFYVKSIWLTQRKCVALLKVQLSGFCANCSAGYHVMFLLYL